MSVELLNCFQINALVCIILLDLFQLKLPIKTQLKCEACLFYHYYSCTAVMVYNKLFLAILPLIQYCVTAFCYYSREINFCAFLLREICWYLNIYSFLLLLSILGMYNNCFSFISIILVWHKAYVTEKNVTVLLIKCPICWYFM